MERARAVSLYVNKRKKVAKTVRRPFKRTKYTLYRSPGSASGFPDTIVTTLRYVDQRGFNAAAADDTTYTYRMNDIFDPDFTGAGHQPMGYDQLAAVYNRFQVLSSSIKLTVTGQATAADNMLLTLCKSAGDGNAFAANAFNQLEAGGSNMVYTFFNASSNGIWPLPNLQISCIPHKDLKTDLKDTLLQAAFGSTPGAVVYAQVSLQEFTGIDPGVVNVNVVIDYKVKCIGSKMNLAQS